MKPTTPKQTALLALSALTPEGIWQESARVKRTPVPQHIQDELINKAQAKRERRLARNIKNNHLTVRAWK